VTDSASDRLIRLPLFAGMPPASADQVIHRLIALLKV
jgi:dTDP-4-amino-4,6-dideoxygalactose transaminase